MTEKLFLTEREAASVLRVHPATLGRLAKAGVAPVTPIQVGAAACTLWRSCAPSRERPREYREARDSQRCHVASTRSCGWPSCRRQDLRYQARCRSVGATAEGSAGRRQLRLPPAFPHLRG